MARERRAAHARRWAPLNFRFKCGIEVASQTAWGGDEKLKSKRVRQVTQRRFAQRFVYGERDGAVTLLAFAHT